MLTWLLYVLGLAVTIALLTFIFGKAMGRGEIMPELVDNESLLKLNTQAVSTGKYGDICFDTVIRGYRQDQVDAVLRQLTGEISELKSKMGTFSADEAKAEPGRR